MLRKIWTGLLSVTTIEGLIVWLLIIIGGIYVASGGRATGSSRSQGNLQPWLSTRQFGLRIEIVTGIFNGRGVIRVRLIDKLMGKSEEPEEKAGVVQADAVIVRRGVCIRKYQCDGCIVVTSGAHCSMRK